MTSFHTKSTEQYLNQVNAFAKLGSIICVSSS